MGRKQCVFRRWPRRYDFIASIVRRFGYGHLKQADEGVVLRFIGRVAAIAPAAHAANASTYDSFIRNTLPVGPAQGGFMLRTRFVVSMFSVGLMVLGAAAVSGQDFPSKPIRLVTSPIGGGNDFTARLVAQGLTGGPLGQQIIVDNRPTVLTGDIVSKAPPDGYTLLAAGTSFMIAHLLQESSYDPVRDFSPVTLVGIAPNIVLVHPSLPVKFIKELIILAKARPGELNYASGATGATGHLAAELFKSLAGVNIVRIPYKGTGPALTAVATGQVQMMFSNAASVTALVKSGRVRALAILSAQPSALFPGLPTAAATGLPGYESAAADIVLAPAKTPTAIINLLNQEIVRAINRADVKQKFFDSGVEIVGSSPEELGNKIKSEIAKWGKVIKDAGIKAQ